MTQNNEQITYASVGVNYDQLDPMKRLAQLLAAETGENMERFGMWEVAASRGESAYVWEEADRYNAFVIEGLGTKNIVADATRQITGKTHYDTLAQDTVAMIVNDLIVLGADPQVVNAYFAVGSSDWFSDEERAADLVNGWAAACSKAGAVWGGGETPTLKGVVDPSTIELAGAAIGMIQPKERLTLGNKLTAGDSILLVESNGIHANGLTLARAVADKLPQGYETPIADGRSYGETLLDPTHIYAGLTRDLFEAGIDIHYMSNITGHGWRKIMRANREFTYMIERVPEAQAIFQFLQEQSGNDDTEMYGNFNMGAGFAIFVPPESAQLAQDIALSNHGFNCMNAGHLEDGPKQVVIQPKGITFQGSTLAVR